LKLFSQAFALTCLAQDKVQDRKVFEDNKNKEIMELRKGMDRLQMEINRLSDLYKKFEHLYTEKTQEALALFEEKDKLLGEIENLKKEMSHKEKDSNKMIESLKDDVTRSFLAGFEIALEQATIVHLTMDLSTLDPGKTVVDDQLRED